MASDDDWWTKTTSPDGAYVWLVDAQEVKMSHWIVGGALERTEPKERLFRAPHGWSFETRTWEPGGVLVLEGRRYPGRLPGITVRIDLASRTGVIEAPEAPEAPGVPLAPAGARSLDEIERWLEAFPAFDD